MDWEGLLIRFEIRVTWTVLSVDRTDKETGPLCEDLAAGLSWDRGGFAFGQRSFHPPSLALSKEGWRRAGGGLGVMGQPLNALFIWICWRGWNTELDLDSRQDSHVEKPGRNLTHRGQGAERR